jgi:hypothetical protein
MSLSYTWEKFHVAVSSLASGTGSIQERLCNAYTYSLMLLEVHKPDDLPAEMRDDFEQIVRELTAVEPVGSEGSVQASTNAMTDLKASEIAEKIVSLYDEITRMCAVEADIR